MTDQFGKSAVVLVVAAGVCGVFRWFTVPTERAPAGAPGKELVVWTFDRASAESFPDRIASHPVDVRTVPVRLLDVRLMAQSLARTDTPSPADVVETEITSTGKYLTTSGSRAFLPLDQRLAGTTWYRSIPESRKAAWRDPAGRQLLVPRDLHPVVLLYRPDLFQQVGLDPAQARTWSELIDLCRRYEAARTDLGQPHFRSLELPTGNAGVLLLILQQRRIPLLTPDGRPDLSDPRIAGTLVQYASWVAAAGAAPARSAELTAADLASGRIAMLPAADWRVGQVRRFAPELAGQIRLRPLPMYSLEENNAPTASWGGTGIGIPAAAADPDASWQLIDSLYRDQDAPVRRYLLTSVLPVSPATWSDPRITAADPYFGGQAVGRLLAALASELPPTRVSPQFPAVQMELNGLVAAVVRAYRSGGVTSAEEAAHAGLTAAQRRLDATSASTAHESPDPPPDPSPEPRSAP